MLKKYNILGLFLVIFISLFGFAMIACDDDDDYTNPMDPNGEPGENQVWMQGTAFVPSTLTVSVGTTVTWTNKDPVAHTATSGTPGNPTGTFSSGNLSQNGTFSHTFDTAGTFNYFCEIHPTQMTGQIVVQSN